MDASGNPIGNANYDICESALGRRASHGCVRVQRKANADGYNHSWLWNNLRGEKNVKIIIWDDDGRKLTETDASTPMYYNPTGGKKYHTTARCSSVKSAYLPLTGITYGDLSRYPYNRSRRPARHAAHRNVRKSFRRGTKSLIKPMTSWG